MSAIEYSLVGDIGGTNARFGLVMAGEVTPTSVEVLKCAGYPSLNDVLDEYLSRVGVTAIGRACLAVASPVRGSVVRMTNRQWQFDREEVRSRFGWRSFKVVNDFTAMALGIPRVRPKQLVHVCGGPGDSARPRLVIGPGTGLGVSGLVPTKVGWVPLMTEGGHVDFAPTDDLEVEVLRFLKARFGRVSVERILCGPGLVNLYQALVEIHREVARFDEPEMITRAALEKADPLANCTLDLFFGILGRVAGNGVLTLGSFGGVYLTGGILPKVIDLLLESPFQMGFEDKGRMRALMESTPVYLVTDSNTGLLGAAEALENPEV